MENHTDIKPIGQVWDKTELDEINAWSKLTVLANESYSVGAAAKSAAGIGTPRTTLEPTHAPIAWFFVGTRLPFTWVLLAYPAAGIYSVMVARAGQPSGWSVSKVADSSNSVRATAMRLEPQVGSDNLSTLEAAIMATIPTPLTPEILLVNGQAVTTSLALADYFGKRHDDVIRKIRSLECSPDFRLRNFTETVYDRPNPAGGAPIPTPCYLLTRDGFFFVAMGFTGRRAAEFKEAYIAAFNAMEQQVADRPTPFALMVSQLDADGVRESVWAVMQSLSVIREVWDDQLYDGLKAIGSPLAVSLHDRIAQACWSIQTVARAADAGTLSEALASTRPPVLPQCHRCPQCAPSKPSKPAAPNKASAPSKASNKGGRRREY